MKLTHAENSGIICLLNEIRVDLLKSLRLLQLFLNLGNLPRLHESGIDPRLLDYTKFRPYIFFHDALVLILELDHPRNTQMRGKFQFKINCVGASANEAAELGESLEYIIMLSLILKRPLPFSHLLAL